MIPMAAAGADAVAGISRLDADADAAASKLVLVAFKTVLGRYSKHLNTQSSLI